MGAVAATGRKRFAPKTSSGTRERTPQCRARTSLISESWHGALASRQVGSIAPFRAVRDGGLTPSPQDGSSGAKPIVTSHVLNGPMVGFALGSTRPTNPRGQLRVNCVGTRH